MIDGTEKPKIPLKFAKRGARYKNLATSRDFLGRHIKFCKQNTAMLIELRENQLCKTSTRHRNNSKQSGIVALDSCFALFGARQYGVTTRESFLGYLKLMLLFFVLYHFMLPGNFYCGSEIRHGIFWGINFGPAIFWGFV